MTLELPRGSTLIHYGQNGRIFSGWIFFNLIEAVTFYRCYFSKQS